MVQIVTVADFRLPESGHSAELGRDVHKATVMRYVRQTAAVDINGLKSK